MDGGMDTQLTLCMHHSLWMARGYPHGWDGQTTTFAKTANAIGNKKEWVLLAASEGIFP